MASIFFRPIAVTLALIYCYQLVVVAPKAGKSGDLVVQFFSNFTVSSLWFDLLLYFFAIALVGYFWSLMLVFSAIGLRRLCKFLSLDVRCALVFCVSIIFIFSLNAYLYPHSTFSWSPLLPIYPFVALLAGFLWLVLLVGGIVASWRDRSVERWFSLILLFSLFPFFLSDTAGVHRSQHRQPNIVVIGVDALRPDRVGYYGFEPSVTPNIDQLLKLGKNYTNTYSPMGRTHVAWYSMLEGKYPQTHGLRFNLGENVLTNKKIPLLDELKQAGYFTIWSIDERRFNNFSSEYGFDEVVGPGLGAADFVIGLIYDNPISNWVVNTRVGSWLFSYVHSNRALYKVYNPYVYVNDIVDAVKSAPDKPLFLAAHLTLPHYPFLSHMMVRPEGFEEIDKGDVTQLNYLSMVHLADKQVGSLIKQLKLLGMLENTVVYLLSDHGEGFLSDANKIVSKNPYANLSLNVNGHGTNLLNTVQNKVLLGRIDFRNINPGFDRSLRSLIDLAPTLMVDAGINVVQDYEGYSLFQEVPDDRVVMMESSFFIDALNQSAINEFQVASQSFEFYKVDEKGQLSLREKTIPLLMKSKQYAAISNDKLLLLLPYMDEDAIVLDTNNDTWWPISAHGGDLEGVDFQRLLIAACKYRERSGVKPLTVCRKGSG